MDGTQPVVVLRVESEDGNGPYDSRNHGWIVDCGESTAPKREWPGDYAANQRLAERLRKANVAFRDIRYGFKHENQFRDWFNAKHRHALARNGLRVVVYEVPPNAVEYGHCQVVFNRPQATILGVYPIPQDDERLTA